MVWLQMWQLYGLVPDLFDKEHNDGRDANHGRRVQRAGYRVPETDEWNHVMRRAAAAGTELHQLYLRCPVDVAEIHRARLWLLFCGHRAHTPRTRFSVMAREQGA